ncbi:hypothetical protein [Nannocystis punicea]|uniref:Uncharacterized protein n=1 Tax=Nannocystis punicea TaxID=2995304 RepID=A0ABY7H6F0_9BACT|nr:hypothetical protein [Nannocystis poenicansa]WAS94838.1 hypothetical protein O0S08_01645 [Nannocystis poenicansa]
MKQPSSRNTFKRIQDVLGVYLQEGAPLTDAAWNESVDTAWASVRDAIVASGLRGTAGQELQIVPVYVGAPAQLTDLLIKGGPAQFYCGGLPVSWPEDVSFDRQSGWCSEPAATAVLDANQTEPVIVWVESRVETVDETDVPGFRDPALQSDRGSFRQVVRSRVKLAAASAVPERLAEPLRSLPPVAELLPDLPHDRWRPTNVRLTVQGSYDGDENVHYHVELVGEAERFDRHTAAVEVLWDDRAASTVTTLAADVEQLAQEIEVVDATGFEAGDYVRIEAEGVDGQIYRITQVEERKLKLDRVSCAAPVSLRDAVIVDYEVRGRPEVPTELVITMTTMGDCIASPGDLVHELMRSEGGRKIPFGDAVWQVERVISSEVEHEVTLVLKPHFGITQALQRRGEARPLMSHARILDNCVVVEEAACWQPGMQVWISGRRVEVAADDPCAKPRADVDDQACWPAREPLYCEEEHTIAWIERCGESVECCGENHKTMTLRLARPLSADHRRCCDEVRPIRPIKVRRYAGYQCRARLHAVWPCCPETGGVCCLKCSISLGSGLEVVLTYRGMTVPRFEPGDSWSFAARVGGWYESRVFAAPDEMATAMCPLALIVPGDQERPHQFYDLRPTPAAFDPSPLLEQIRLASAELAEYFYEGYSTEWLRQAAHLARYSRVQANVRRGRRWQMGLAESLYRFARNFLQTHKGSEETVKPEVLTKARLLAVAFRALAHATVETRHAPTLSNRELAAIAGALTRAASVAASVLAGCCGDEKLEWALKWPPALPLDEGGPRRPPPPAQLPDCPDRLPEPDPDDSCDHEEEDEPDHGLPERPSGPRPPGTEPGPEGESPDRPSGPRPPETEPGPEGELPDRPPGTRPPDIVPVFPIERPDIVPVIPNVPIRPDIVPVVPNVPIRPDIVPVIPNVPIRPDIVPVIPNLPTGPAIVPVFPVTPIPVRPVGPPIEPAFPERPMGDAPGVGATAPELPLVSETDDRRWSLMELPLTSLKVLEHENDRTVQRLVADWPRLGDAHGARTRGSARKRVVAAVDGMVEDLRALAESDASERERTVALRSIWSRTMRAEVPVPRWSLVVRSLPATRIDAEGEE